MPSTTAPPQSVSSFLPCPTNAPINGGSYRTKNQESIRVPIGEWIAAVSFPIPWAPRNYPKNWFGGAYFCSNCWTPPPRPHLASTQWRLNQTMVLPRPPCHNWAIHISSCLYHRDENIKVVICSTACTPYVVLVVVFDDVILTSMPVHSYFCSKKCRSGLCS